MEKLELAGVAGEAMVVVSRGSLGLEEGAREGSFWLVVYRVGIRVLTCST